MTLEDEENSAGYLTALDCLGFGSTEHFRGKRRQAAMNQPRKRKARVETTGWRSRPIHRCCTDKTEAVI
jgi:hypothetical protein